MVTSFPHPSLLMIFVGAYHSVALPMSPPAPTLPFRPTTNRKPRALGLEGSALLLTPQQADGQDEILSLVPVALLPSGTIYLNHAPAPTIKMNAVIK